MPDVKPGEVLIVGRLKPSLAATLTENYGALTLPAEPAGFLREHGGTVRAVVTTGRFGVDAALMADLPALGAIVNFGVGYDTTDVAAASARGIQVSNTPDVLTDCVADTALGLYLDVLRRFSAADRFVREGRWEQGDFPLQHRASGRRVGILGLGRIGRAIATRLEALGCTISYHNRRRLPEVPYAYAESALALAREVEVLVVAASGGADSAGLVNREVLAALGSRGYLVNIARGNVVDEESLVELLESGRLGGAGLDVYADEPHVPARLRALDSVVLLPHMASGTVETRGDMEALTLENLDRFLVYGSVVTPV